MGCDIHIFTEFRNTSSDAWSKHWYALNYHPINPGRNYELFKRLSGVRGHNDNPIATQGWPEQVSSSAEYNSRIYIDPELKGEERRGGRVSLEIASQWVNSNYSWFIHDPDSKKVIAVSNPDWHSYGHCTVKQMTKALRGCSSAEYRAMLAAARSLEKDGMEVRFLFYYDN